MLYKVTPMMAPPKLEKKVRGPGAPRKKRRSAIYDADGHEVLLSLMCLKCKGLKPLGQFGLRKMADGAIRNQPWCRTCRGASGQKPKVVEAEVTAVEPAELVVAAPDPSPLPMAAEAQQPLEVVVAAPVETQSA